MVQTNRLTEKLVLHELTVSATTFGEAIERFKPVVTIFGSILNQKGSMGYKDGNVYTDTITFYCRYLPLVDKKKYRVEYGCDLYEIQEITTVQRNKATILVCQRVI